MATLKIQSAEIEPFWATPEILFFLMRRFSNFFLNFIWYESTKMKLRPYFTMELVQKLMKKTLKIPKLQPLDWKSPYWMSLYDPRHNVLLRYIECSEWWAIKIITIKKSHQYHQIQSVLISGRSGWCWCCKLCHPSLYHPAVSTQR